MLFTSLSAEWPATASYILQLAVCYAPLLGPPKCHSLETDCKPPAATIRDWDQKYAVQKTFLDALQAKPRHCQHLHLNPPDVCTILAISKAARGFNTYISKSTAKRAQYQVRSAYV